MNSAQRIIIVLLIISLLAGLLTANKIYYRLSLLWTLLLASSWLFSYMSLRGIKVTRQARFLRSQVGLVFEEKYEINNPGRLPKLWIEVQDGSPLPGTRNSFVLTMIGSKVSRTFTSRTRLLERGVFPLGPTKLSSGDPFGLFPISRIYENDEALLVYPLIVDIEKFPNPPGLLPGGDALRRRTPQITSNASGVREYVPGDPLNRIHWLSTARRNRLISKEFELDPLAEVWIIIDTYEEDHFSLPYSSEQYEVDIGWSERSEFSLAPSTIEYAVSIAGSLAKFYLRRDRTVGTVYARSALEIIPSDRGLRQLNKILESLSMIQADGKLPLQDVVEIEARHLPRGSTIVIITPNTSDKVFRITDVLLRRGLRPVVILIDSSTFGGLDFPIKLVASLKFLGVPVFKVSNGDNLVSVLSNGEEKPKLY